MADAHSVFKNGGCAYKFFTLNILFPKNKNNKITLLNNQ